MKQKILCIQCGNQSMVYDKDRYSLTCQNCKYQIQADMYLVSIQIFYKQLLISALKSFLNKGQTICVERQGLYFLVGFDSQGQLAIINDKELIKENIGKFFQIQQEIIN